MLGKTWVRLFTCALGWPCQRKLQRQTFTVLETVVRCSARGRAMPRGFAIISVIPKGTLPIVGYDVRSI